MTRVREEPTVEELPPVTWFMPQLRELDDLLSSRPNRYQKCKFEYGVEALAGGVEYTGRSVASVASKVRQQVHPVEQIRMVCRLFSPMLAADIVHYKIAVVASEDTLRIEHEAEGSWNIDEDLGRIRKLALQHPRRDGCSAAEFRSDLPEPLQPSAGRRFANELFNVKVAADLTKAGVGAVLAIVVQRLT